MLSNSYHADKLSSDDELWGQWAEADSLSKYTTVQHGERFTFQAVYHNNSTDCHRWGMCVSQIYILHRTGSLHFDRIYINTDTYYTDGYDAEAVINKIMRGNKEMSLKTSRLCEGTLGEYYHLSVQTK